LTFVRERIRYAAVIEPVLLNRSALVPPVDHTSLFET